MNKGNAKKEIHNSEFSKNMESLAAFIESKKFLRNEHGKLMLTLHKAQNLFGYIPKEAMNLIFSSPQRLRRLPLAFAALALSMAAL
ncbi:MAG: hypothetical protein ACE14V_03420, partial [bacterium]